MKRVLILDTSILCVWLGVPGKGSCGPDHDRWDAPRVAERIQEATDGGATLVLPLASIIETGNHISQGAGDRYEKAQQLATVIRNTADEKTPWAAFTDQSVLWGVDQLRTLAGEWPQLAAQKLSIGDATIKHVAEHYACMGFHVEILTGDQGLKAHEPAAPPPIPRRRK
jgi:hypothetical protein